MSKGKHTPGPIRQSSEQWRVIVSDSIDGWDPLDGKNVVCVVIKTDKEERDRYRVQHIIDCWNALEGINPEVVKEMVEFIKTISAIGCEDGIGAFGDKAENILRKARGGQGE